MLLRTSVSSERTSFPNTLLREGVAIGTQMMRTSPRLFAEMSFGMDKGLMSRLMKQKGKPARRNFWKGFLTPKTATRKQESLFL